MSEDQRKFIEVLKKQIIIGAVAYMFIIAATLVGFYFKTNADIAQIKKEQRKTDIVMETKATKNELKNFKDYFKEDIRGIKSDTRIIKEYLLNKKK